MIYIFIFIIFIGLGILYDILNFKAFKIQALILQFLILTLLSAFRFRIGGDTSNYIHSHQFIPSLFEIDFINESLLLFKEPGWILFSSFCKLFSEDFLVLQIFHSILVNSLFFYFIRKTSNYWFITSIFYYILIFPFLNFEILRQALAVSIYLFFGVKFLTEKKWTFYLLSVILCTLFHYSSFLLVIVPFLNKFKKASNIKLFLNSTFVFLSGLILSGYLKTYFEILNNRFLFLRNADTYIEYNFTFVGLIYSYFLYVLLPLGLRIVLKQNRGESKYDIFLIYFIMFGSIASFFPVLYRTVFFFIPFYIIFVSEVLILSISKLKFSYSLKIFSFLILTFFILFIHTWSWFETIDTARNIKWYIRWHPYYSVFTKETSQERESLLVL